MYLCIGINNWIKDDFRDDAFLKWLERTSYPTKYSATMLEFEDGVEFKDVRVDEMGGVSYPEGKLVKKEIIELEPLAKFIEEVQTRRDDFDEAKYLLMDEVPEEGS